MLVTIKPFKHLSSSIRHRTVKRTVGLNRESLYVCYSLSHLLPRREKNSRLLLAPKSESYDFLSRNTDSHHLNVPTQSTPLPNSSSSIHKSLPDLAFITQYSKEMPRSRTASPTPPSSNAPSSAFATSASQSAASSTTTSQQDAERPRTLKAIKRYKNSKHSTEPLNVFYSPQLRKTFAAVPASAVMNGSNEAPTVIKMKLPPPSSYPIKQQQQQQQAAALKSCLKYGPRANSCDIQAMLQERRSPAAPLVIPEPASNQVRSVQRLFVLNARTRSVRNRRRHRANAVLPKRTCSPTVRTRLGLRMRTPQAHRTI